jgi:hypothetical protein
MSTASMTFGRPTRMVIPRGSVWFANLAYALIGAIRRLDRWQLERQRSEPTTPSEVMEYARQIEATDPGFASDLRAAALRASSRDDA